MPDLLISQSTLRLPGPADLIPMEISGSSDIRAGHLTVEAFHRSLPPASETEPGAALAASAGAVSSAAAAGALELERVVTPASLAHRISRIHFAPGFLYLGRFSPTGAADLYTRFTAATGRPPSNGDLLVIANLADELLILALESSSGTFFGFNATQGEFAAFL